jgi:hypothetical protein
MRYLAILAAGAIAFAVGTSANAAPLSPTGVSTAGHSNVIQVQDKKMDKKMSMKKEGMGKKMKRSSRRGMHRMGMHRMGMGWTFTAHCITGTMSCNHGGQSQFEARNACILTHPGCFVTDNQ